MLYSFRYRVQEIQKKAWNILFFSFRKFSHHLHLGFNVEDDSNLGDSLYGQWKTRLPLVLVWDIYWKISVFSMSPNVQGMLSIIRKGIATKEKALFGAVKSLMYPQLEVLICSPHLNRDVVELKKALE